MPSNCQPSCAGRWFWPASISSKESLCGDRTAAAEEVRAALKKAKLELLEVVSENEEITEIWRYQSMVLLDSAAEDLDQSLAALPHLEGAVVFQDGTFGGAGWPRPARVPKGQGAGSLCLLDLG